VGARALRRALRAAAALLYGLAVALLFWPVRLLLTRPETAEGLACGLVAFGVLALAGALLVGASRRVTMPIGLATLGLLAWVIARVPDGTPLPGSRLESRFDGAWNPRLSPFNLVPEIDQVKLGALLAPDVFARLGPRATNRVLELTIPMYREMRADPAMRALGSVMHLAFTNQRLGHQWRYVPAHRAGEKLPLLVFFHGAGGNFASYLWFWKQAADRLRIAVVLPTMGWGNHSRDDVPLPDDPAIDRDHVWVGGLSNGAIQAIHTADGLGAKCEGAFLVSPVDVPAPKKRDRQLPLLVFYGGLDEVIDRARVERAAGVALSSTARGSKVVYEDEDHFLMFSAKARFLEDLELWMLNVRSYASPSSGPAAGPATGPSAPTASPPGSALE
jgi:hypothetical protein